MIGVRPLRLAGTALGLLALAIRERAGHVPAERSALPRRLRLAFERLGPTFVKAGQALSLRQDLLPERYLVELSKLQADVAPFPASDARREIETELGMSISALFSSFDDQPLAAASIAQVHSAAMPDGTRVVVKVRRPGIRSRIDGDMRSLIRVLRLLLLLSPRLAHYRLVGLAQEIWNNLRRETDFRLEARAMRRFSQAFAGWPGIEAPDVIEGMATEKVLVQRRTTGRIIGDASLKAEGPTLAARLVEAYLHQIFVLGFFHGDPHPGNLFFTDKQAICFHDFGLVGQLDRATRGELAMFLQAFVEQDAQWMLDAGIALGLFNVGDEREAFLVGIDEILADYSALPLKDWSIAELFLRVSRLGPAGSVRIPFDLLVLMRAMFLLENALRKLDPEMNIVETMADRGSAAMAELLDFDFGRRFSRLRFELGLAGSALPDALASAVNRVRRTGIRPELRVRLGEIDDARKTAERTGNRLAMSVVTLGLYIGSSLLMQHSIGPRLGGVPVLALAGYVLALWYTIRLGRAIARSGHF